VAGIGVPDSSPGWAVKIVQAASYIITGGLHHV